MPKEAPLLPKLRGYFAEFLNKGSLEHLRILISPTCVGLRYGHKLHSLEVFLGSMIRASLRPKDSSLHLGVDPPDLPGGSTYLLEPGQPSPG